MSMHGNEESDEVVVPAKRLNKEGLPSAEIVEGRASPKENGGQATAVRTPSRGAASNRLAAVRQAVRQSKTVRFTALLHHITVELRSYIALKRDAASGIDGVTWRTYGENLEAKLKDLHERIHKGSYRARPARRTYIPKADGSKRPLSIWCLEDKIVQQAVVRVLEAIYEEDFVGFSYGFRPRRDQHDALDALHAGILRRRVNWVLDADTGVVTRLAARVHANVTGLDLNAGMLSVARSVPSEGRPIDWVEGSALVLPFPPDSFDVIFCQLGLQFFPDPRRALREMHRVLRGSGRIALSVYSPIERTPGANAFALALDSVLGADASRIKRGEHSFADAEQVGTLLKDAGFGVVELQTVVQTITFPSVLDYLRFQLLATPMTALLSDKTEPERQEVISLVASKTIALSTTEMLEGGRFAFSQEAFVAIARNVG
jgi:SAM-dependent methyltransferase